MKYDGLHARRIMEKQLPDGSWGQFHSLSMQARREKGITTEMALRRLQNLGFTMQDACIRRAVAYMDACLHGENNIPDPREKTHDWDAFTQMMLATWIRRFTQENPAANAVAHTWADILTAAFAGEVYDPTAYCTAFAKSFGHPPRGGRFVDFVSFYPVSLTAGLLDAQTEKKVIRYVLQHPQGMYYICDGPLNKTPDVFASVQTVRWLYAMELLAEHPGAKAQLGFVKEYLLQNRDADGMWDLSSAAKDGVTFPLSDSWRKAETRKADCTARILRLMKKL